MIAQQLLLLHRVCPDQLELASASLVVEDGVLLGHLPLLVLNIVPVQDGQGDDQCSGHGKKCKEERAEIVRENAENMYVGQI